MSKIDAIISAIECQDFQGVSIKTPEIETTGMVFSCVKDRFRAGCAILLIQEDPEIDSARAYQVTEDEIELDF